MALNEPTLLVVIVVGVVGCVVPSYLMVMVDDPAKPVPDAVTTVPPTPFAGLSVMDGATVKVARAEWDPSVAVTVWGPKTEAGTMKGAENKPETSVVAVATVDEPNVIMTFEDGLKLDPETVMDKPTIPEVGFRVIKETITVSVEEPVREPVPTLPVTVSVKVPPGVEPEVSIERVVEVGLDGLGGNGTGLARVTVLLDGAPVNDRRMVLGRPVAVEPEARETLTV